MFHCRKVDSAAGRVELLDLSGVIEYDPFTPAKPSYTGSTFALIHWPGLKTIMQVSLPFAARLRSNNDPSRTSISSTSVTIVTEFFGRKTCTVPSSEDKRSAGVSFRLGIVLAMLCFHGAPEDCREAIILASQLVFAQGIRSVIY